MTDLLHLIEVVLRLERVHGLLPSEVAGEKDPLMVTWNGLHGEVVVCDEYRIKTLDFQPEVVIDIGANVGFFTRFARITFPDAKIVAVEPDADNFMVLKACTSGLSKMVLLNKAIGNGVMYHVGGAANGSGESYISEGPGFSTENLVKQPERFLKCGILSVRLSDLVAEYVSKGQSFMLKIDCEGGENAIFDHQKSIECLQNADYIAMELHNYAISGGENVKKLTQEVIHLLEKTHNCIQTHVNFYARKKT